MRSFVWIGATLAAVVVSAIGTPLPAQQPLLVEQAFEQAGVDHVFGSLLLSDIACVTFSPDGKYLVTGAAAIEFRDPRTGQVLDDPPPISLAEQSTQEDISAIVFSPDGKTIACVVGSETVCVVDVASRATLFERQLDLISRGHVSGMAFSPDGTKLLVCSSVQPVFVLDATSGEELAKIARPLQYARSPAAYSPDGRFFVFARRGGFHVYDAATNQEARQFDAFGSSVGGFDFISDTEFVAVGADYSQRDGERGRYVAALRIYNAATGELVREFKRDDDLTEGGAVKVLPDKQRAVVKVSNEIRIYKLSSGEIVQRSEPSYTDREIPGEHGLAVSPDGKTLAIGGSANARARLFDVESCTRLLAEGAGHDHVVHTTAVSPDSRRIATVSRGAIHVWNATTRELEQTFPAEFNHELAKAVWSPNGRFLYALAHDHDLGLLYERKAVLLAFDTSANAPVFEAPIANFVMSCAVSPDGALVAVYAGSNVNLSDQKPPWVEVFESRTGRSVARIPLVDSIPVNSMRFSDDSKQLLTVDYVEGDRTVKLRVWDARTGEAINVHDFGQRYIASIAAGSPRMVGSTRSELAVFDTDRRESLRKLETPGEFLRSATISADGKRVAAIGRKTRLLEDGREVLASNAPMTIRVWDVDTGVNTHTFAELEFKPFDIQFSPDGQTLYAGLPEGVAVAWDLTEGDE